MIARGEEQNGGTRVGIERLYVQGARNICDWRRLEKVRITCEVPEPLELENFDRTCASSSSALARLRFLPECFGIVKYGSNH